MHCKACELLIKKSSDQLEGGTITHANHKKWTIEVEWKGKEKKKNIQAILEDYGYPIVEEKPEKTSMSWINRCTYLFIAFVLAFVLIKADIMSWMTGMQIDSSLWVILLLWLVASVSSCLAVTWWVIMWFTELVDKSKGRRWHAKLHGSFQIGRIVWFFILGALLWALWNIVSLSLWFASRLNIVIAIMFVYLGLQLLWITPSFSSLWIHLPDRWTKKILSQNNPYLAPLVGALTFFLPCGFTQSIQFMSLASGGRFTWGLMMMLFAIGTLPWLLALWMGTSFAKDYRKQWFETIVAVILVTFWILTFRGSANILWRTDQINNSWSVTVSESITDSIETIELRHNWSQLVPETTTLSAWKNYTIQITPDSDGLWCMSTITMPLIDRAPRRVIKGEILSYQINNAQPGQYSFVCASMWMSQWKIVVE
jgi:sulfite exporter TauE/SafE